MALRLDDLQFEGLKIYQDPKGYCFTSDSVLLANFVHFLPESKVVEFCSGTGVISILLSKKQKPKQIHAFEVMKKPYEIFVKSIELNNLQNLIFPHLTELEKASEVLGRGYADVIVCNPPYLPAQKDSSIGERQIAEQEIKTNLENVVKSASEVLKYGGKLFMVHRVDRLVDVLCTLRQYKLEPKKITIVYPDENIEPVVFLVEAVSGGKKGLRLNKVYAALMNKSSYKSTN